MQHQAWRQPLANYELLFLTMEPQTAFHQREGDRNDVLTHEASEKQLRVHAQKNRSDSRSRIDTFQQQYRATERGHIVSTAFGTRIKAREMLGERAKITSGAHVQKTGDGHAASPQAHSDRLETDPERAREKPHRCPNMSGVHS